MFVLGINAAFHDPSAALIENGRLVAAAEEERFNRVKHGKRPVPFSAYELPFNAIDFCLKEGGISLGDVDRFAYSFDPFLRLNGRGEGDVLTLPLAPSARPVDPEWEGPWDPLFLSHVVNAPRHLVGGVPLHLSERFRGTKAIGPERWHFVSHHLCHAASAFFVSPFDEAAVLTIDGRGEKATTSYSVGTKNKLEVVGEVLMPHSLGMLYEQVTAHLGFLHSSDEYKVMALASFGSPSFIESFRAAIHIGAGGDYEIDARRLWNELGPQRLPGEPLLQRHYDVARSLQTALEETVLHIVGWLYRETGMESLCMAGGVALNCVLNSCIRDKGPFSRVWVQPASGDAGTALGAALLADMKERDAATRSFSMEHAFFGPAYSDDEIEDVLISAGLPFRRQTNVAEAAADLLAEEKAIGWFQGRMEFGPRALGGRSILASPRRADMRTRLNLIKGREDFRPLAPVVVEEEADRWFRMKGVSSPFMLFVHEVLPEKAGLIPAACHVDGTARIQTVNRSQNALYYDLIKAFEARTGVPVLVNTSFNTGTGPIVCTPKDALACFWTSGLDALVMGSYLLTK